LFLFPSNIECSPIVLFEAAASETPFLTSNAGNSEEIVSWLGGGILLPTVTDRLGYGRVRIEKSVKILEELFFNNELRNKLGTNGYKNWKNGFSWEIIAKKYEKLYQDLMKE